MIPKMIPFFDETQTLSTLKSQTLIARARLRANVPRLALDIPRMAANVLRVGCRKAMRSPVFPNEVVFTKRFGAQKMGKRYLE